MIGELAMLMMTRNQIALALEVDPEKLSAAIDNPKTSVHKAYYKAQLETEAKIRKSVIQLAIAGSAPAQALADKYITNFKNAEDCQT
jgi:hypothetical protein